MGMSWDNHMPGLVLTNPPKDREDPEVKALEQRLADAGWAVVDKRVGDDVAVTIGRECECDWPIHEICPACPVRSEDEERTYRGPTTVDALDEACEAVGA